jgi:tetratricopeptide (TPR) repeat protein
MEATGYTRPNFDENLIAVGYDADERWGKPTEKEWDGDAPYLHLKGNGGMLSTTVDLFKWDRALSSDEILSKAAKEKYYRPALRPDETGNSIYAYGWDVTETERKTRRVWHNGTNRVFYADFYRFIDDGVLMTNKSLNSRNDTGRVISKIIFDAGYEPVVPIAETAANRAFTDEIIELALEKGLNAAVERYKRRNKKIDLLESVSIRKGFDLIREKRLKAAIDIFKLNILAFPKLSIAFEGLGEAYLEAGDKKSALENYKKSLSLDPENADARAALKRLEGK